MTTTTNTSRHSTLLTYLQLVWRYVNSYFRDAALFVRRIKCTYKHQWQGKRTSVSLIVVQVQAELNCICDTWTEAALACA